MPFEVQDGPLPGVKIIRPKVFRDARGYFMESYNAQALAEAGFTETFVQDNLSFSRKGTLRGLHFQAPPHAQGKLVTVVHGRAVDAFVDIRRGSPTYGQAGTVLLDADDPVMAYIPPGFAHGFAVLSESCLFSYKCTAYYAPQAEGGLHWNDPDAAIDWGVSEPLVAERDEKFPGLRNFSSPFA